MQLWIGTSGYVYPDWVGPFYPAGTSSSRMLNHYTKHFPLVELNYTFYRPPTPEGLAKIARRAPPGFQFIVKLYQAFSHDHDLSGAAPFREAIDVLREEGRLLALLCQYPGKFRYGQAGLEEVGKVAGQFRGYDLAFEFRHRSWHRPEVPRWLGERGLHLVSVDAPAIPALYPSGLVQSSRLLYVRFHSRRSASWYASEKDRYDYLYRPEELQGWVDALAHREMDADRALLLFNNCRSGQAARNALELGELLARAPGRFDIVPPFASQKQDEQGLLF